MAGDEHAAPGDYCCNCVLNVADVAAALVRARGQGKVEDIGPAECVIIHVCVMLRVVNGCPAYLLGCFTANFQFSLSF